MASNISRAQVASLQSSFEEKMSNLVQQMQSASQTFTGVVQKEWADNDSVKALNTYKTNMDGFLEELNTNITAFHDMLQGVCDYYTRNGRMDPITVPAFTKQVATFMEGEPQNTLDGDRQGLANDNTSADAILTALKNYKTKCNTIRAIVQSSLQSINAFGDPELKQAVAKSGAKIVEILGQHIEKTNKDLDTLIEQAIQSYKDTATNSTTSATMEVSGGGN